MHDGSKLDKVGVRAGDILGGKYHVKRVLGVGGMGVVVEAHHVHLDERVAIKLLLSEALQNPEVVARFAREARAAVKIKSEYVARVIDVGILEHGEPYMVMEYLEGCDLAAMIRHKGAFRPDQAVELILQTCEAIADAHAQGIIHRDLKPPNLFCIKRSDGLLAVKVLDFGISKMTARRDSSHEAPMTRTSAVFGSPLYMSPEQMLSTRDVDARTDIWALGVILYEMLTTRSPFDGETLPEVYARISSQPPPPLRDSCPDGPLALESVILKCLEKDRTRRYSNVGELALALLPFAPRRAHASVERIRRIIDLAGLSDTAVAAVPATPSGTSVTVEPIGTSSSSRVYAFAKWAIPAACIGGVLTFGVFTLPHWNASDNAASSKDQVDRTKPQFERANVADLSSTVAASPAVPAINVQSRILPLPVALPTTLLVPSATPPKPQVSTRAPAAKARHQDAPAEIKARAETSDDDFLKRQH
jgi:serine/threonine-protein kinase